MCMNWNTKKSAAVLDAQFLPSLKAIIVQLIVTAWLQHPGLCLVFHMDSYSATLEALEGKIWTESFNGSFKGKQNL